MLVRALNRGIIRVFANPLVVPLFKPAMHGCATIFMLHRFRHPELRNFGHDPEALRTFLRYLRQKQYCLLSVEDLLSRLEAGDPLRDRTVAFTLDDGYLDQATVAAPIFAEFDCPATTFVTTGFLEGEQWQWWDQIEFILLSTERAEVRASLQGQTLRYPLPDEVERMRAVEDLTMRCKSLANDGVRTFIAELAEEARIELPATAPPRYAAMSWEQLRAAEQAGMSFGPHTVQHPILARVSEAASRREIAVSWEKLGNEARRPVPIFCYPNGRSIDFGDREIRTLRELGFRAALAAESGFAAAGSYGEHDDARFRLPRIAYSDDLSRMIFAISGAERLQQQLARRLRAEGLRTG